MAATATGHSAEKALERKDKSPLPMPVGDLSSDNSNYLTICSSVVGDTGPQRHTLCILSKCVTRVFIPSEIQISIIVLVVCSAICYYPTWYVSLNICSTAIFIHIDISVASIAGIICEKLDILCEADGYSLKYAAIYIEGLDFISIRYLPSH